MVSSSKNVFSGKKKLQSTLLELATDLRWTWSHSADALWKTINPEVWQATRNPYTVLQNLDQARLDKLVQRDDFNAHLKAVIAARKTYDQRESWADRIFDTTEEASIAYFSMEFGLGNSLPLYAGGLGILAGDHLKAASDLGVPIVGIGLLYDQGYFRQVVDENGWQQEIYCFNDSRNLPIQPVYDDSGAWLSIGIAFPGRRVCFKVWRVKVGRVDLYLLDSNDPQNRPTDQGITGSLYGGSRELRLTQEIALGIGGWRVIEALKLPITVCHLNEGHAAFAALERARYYQKLHQVDFWEALCVTSAGNVFTTHTPVPSAFDTYTRELLAFYGHDYAKSLGIDGETLLGLGRVEPGNSSEVFNMAYLAARCCRHINGVSRLHGEVSRALFCKLFPGWPLKEIPIRHITNGVHVPTWASPRADKVWTESCGKSRWLGEIAPFKKAIEKLSDEEIWRLRNGERDDLVLYVRSRVARQSAQRPLFQGDCSASTSLLDSDVLTLGFARRFAQYKRPDVLLHDPERLVRLLNDAEKPVQLIVAGKAHPKDDWGKACIQSWITFLKRADVVGRAVFIEDYDMALALELVQGVDLWINTPRRTWEACGTSGMKVLANGGINISSLDGWWEEAYTPDVGWAIGQRDTPGQDNGDKADADALYDLIERGVVPSFYQRDEKNMPRQWISRIRKSMANLAPHFSSNRMVREYCEQVYLPAKKEFAKRSESNGVQAKKMMRYKQKLSQSWERIYFGNFLIYQHKKLTRFELQVYLADVSCADVKVQLYAEYPYAGLDYTLVDMKLKTSSRDVINCHTYTADICTIYPSSHFTPRVIPSGRGGNCPGELALISWWSGDRTLIKGSELGFWETVEEVHEHA